MKNYKEIFTNFYLKYNTSKIDEVDALLKKYKGEEELVFERMCKKYKVDINDFLEADLPIEENIVDEDYISAFNATFPARKPFYKTPIFIIFALLILTSSIYFYLKNSGNNSVVQTENDGNSNNSSSNDNTNEHWLTLQTLINILRGTPYTKNEMLKMLEGTEPSWQFIGKKEEGKGESFRYMRDKKDKNKVEAMYYNPTDLSIELAITNINRFEKIESELNESGFEITKTEKNIYGGLMKTYKKDDYIISTESLYASTGQESYVVWILKQ